VLTVLLKDVPVLKRDGAIVGGKGGKQGSLRFGTRDPKAQINLLKKRCVSIYLRVSSHKQLGGNGVEEQLQAVTESLDKRHGAENWSILNVFVEAASGARAQHKRKLWRQCLDEHDGAKALKLKHEIVVARMDRLCRDPQASKRANNTKSPHTRNHQTTQHKTQQKEQLTGPTLGSPPGRCRRSSRT